MAKRKMKLKVKPFKRVWYRLKSDMYHQHTKLFKRDLKMFYEVVDIEGSCGRVMNWTMKPYNPRYMHHWFAQSRCHWNVIFPCWLLNNRSITGKYAIITGEKHSAIINTETNEIYDPTYSTIDNEKLTLKMLGDRPEIFNIVVHAAHVDIEIFERLVGFLSKKEQASALEILEAHMSTLKNKPSTIV